MSAGAKLAAALVALLVIVGGGWLVGRAVDPGSPDDDHAGMHHDTDDVDDMDDMHHGDESDGADDGDYTLALGSDTLAPKAQELSFTVRDADGAAVTAYDVRHEKELHLILVNRDDPRIYQHLHPALADDGTWSVPVTLAPGAYRAYADTAPTGAEPVVLTADLTVTGSHPAYGPVPGPNTVATVDGFTVSLAEMRGMFTFDVRRDGKAVELEQYLGAGGHLVVIGAKDLSYLHAHPMSGEGSPVGFHVEIPDPGRYVMHFDFQVDGKVHSATFVHDEHAEASMGPSGSSMDDMDMSGMSGHDH